ncbi:MAG TPA: phosphatase PAP2 family protein [Candidatus Limnocylindria bacterium]
MARPMPPVTERARPIWLLAVGCAVGFVLVAILVAAGVTDAADAAIIDVVRARALHDALAPLGPLTELGSTGAVIAIGAVVLLLGLVAGRPRDGVAGAITIGIGALVIELLKRLHGRARPDVLDPIIAEVGYSFPSGHAANATIAYGVLAVLVSRLAIPIALRALIVAGLIVTIFTVGLSRVWLGVHFPSDVLAGWLLGGAFVCAYAAITLPASPGPGEAAADEDPAAPRFDPPAEV